MVSAALRPDEAAPHRDVVTAVRAPAAASALDVALGVDADSDGAVTYVPGLDHSRAGAALFRPDEPPRANSEPVPLPRAPRTEIDPLTADLSRLHVTVSHRFLEKLAAAAPRSPIPIPGAGAAELLEAALDGRARLDPW